MNFTAAILARKLQTIPAGLPQAAAEQHSIGALSEIYGMDIQADNIAETRERMAALAVAFVASRGFIPNPRFVADARAVAERNYQVGNFLTEGLSVFGADTGAKPQGQLRFVW